MWRFYEVQRKGIQSPSEKKNINKKEKFLSLITEGSGENRLGESVLGENDSWLGSRAKGEIFKRINPIPHAWVSFYLQWSLNGTHFILQLWWLNLFMCKEDKNCNWYKVTSQCMLAIIIQFCSFPHLQNNSFCLTINVQIEESYHWQIILVKTIPLVFLHNSI